jgi:type IV pilus assembly protein PilB
MSVRLGEILLKESLITQDQLDKALEFQRSNGGKLGSCLTKMGYITDDDITGVLSRQYGVPSINLKYYEIDPNVIKLIPQDTALRYQVIPLSRVGSVLTIAMTDPTNVFAMDDIKFMTGFNVEPVVASESAIAEAIARFYGGAASSHEELSNLMKDLVEDDQELELAADEQELDAATLEKAAEEAPIIKLVNLILTDSVKRGASDIHVEPYENEMRVRFRVDGVLQTVMNPPMKLRDAITSRMKIMAKLDIAEKRLPQDGRIMIKYKSEGKKKELDFRVSTVPTLYGVAQKIRTQHFAAVRHGASDGADGIGQDEHAVFVGGAAEPGRHQHHDRRRSGGIPVGRNQPGADEGADWPELRCRPSRLPAARPQHHSGGRNSRL